MNTFISSLNYFPGLKSQFKASAIRYESILPYSLEQCVVATKTIASVYETDPNMMYFGATDFRSYDDLKKRFEGNIDEKLKKFVPRSQCTFENVLYFPKPLNIRTLKCGTSYYYDKENQTFIQITKPFIEKNEDWLTQKFSDLKINRKGDLKKCKSYQMFYFSVHKIQQIDTNKVIDSEVHLMNIGGWAAKNDKMLQYAAHDRAIKMRKTVVDAINKVPTGRSLSNMKEYYQVDSKKENFDGMARMVAEFDL